MLVWQALYLSYLLHSSMLLLFPQLSYSIEVINKQKVALVSMHPGIT